MISKEARRKYDKEYNWKNKEKRREYDRQYYWNNREKIRERSRKYYRNNAGDPEKEKAKKIKSKRYRERHPMKGRLANWRREGINITIDSYKKMHNLQDGRCLICKVKESELSAKLCLDHDHIDGYIRGLICRRCNSVLGFIEKDHKKGFRDPLPILKKMIGYLSKKIEK